MDGWNPPITKATLREILATIPDTPQNKGTIDAILYHLDKETIEQSPYTYSALYFTAGANNNLAAGALNVPFNINIQADADFLVMARMYAANTANAAVTQATRVSPNATVLLTNTGSGYQMMDQGVYVPGYFGDGQFPYILPVPMFWSAKSTILCQVSNLDAAAGMNLQLIFDGVKLKRYPDA